MKNLARFGAMVVLSVCQSQAQQPPVIVNLKVIHNGRAKGTPTEIKVSFGGHSLRIPVREGRFEAPPQLVAAQKVILETDVVGSHIRLLHINSNDFSSEDWTLRLSERVNDDYYDWPGPKGADIPTTCMVEFDSVHSDPGRVLFEEHCRTKKNKPAS
jgi:hypothetical protein